jgi:hypothetical protein
MTTSSIELNSDQIIAIQNYQASNNYADAYRYLRDIVRNKELDANPPDVASEYEILETWVDRAASISANDGSFSSEFVRGATESIGASIGKPITDTQFQEASNNLAQNVISSVISTKEPLI